MLPNRPIIPTNPHPPTTPTLQTSTHKTCHEAGSEEGMRMGGAGGGGSREAGDWTREFKSLVRSA